MRGRGRRLDYREHVDAACERQKNARTPEPRADPTSLPMRAGRPEPEYPYGFRRFPS
jgi:hypothetical protein